MSPSSSNNSLYFCLKRWKETYKLSFELADVVMTILDSLLEYCKINNISINEEQGIWNLVKKARSISKEIECVNSSTFKLQKTTIRRIFTERNPTRTLQNRKS